MNLEGKQVLVIGLGMSGRSAAEFCAHRGARVLAVDERPLDALTGLDSLPASVSVQAGAALPDPADFDLVVPSPGVPRERYAERARDVAGDIELCARALQVPVVAVTGTNGKSTTVLLIEAMLRGAGMRARAAGNLGTPALSLVGQALDAAVLEVSSFQLEAVSQLRPRVAVVLNVSPDHLDRHGNVEAYAATKRRLLEQQREGDVAVLNADDPLVRAMAKGTRARVLWFSRREAPEPGVGFDGSVALLRDGSETRRLSLEDFQLPGAHNLENLLAALAATVGLGVDPQRALPAGLAFRGLPHRCEIVAHRAGVTWVNDSKATNVGAAVRSLESFDAPLVWIAGGRDKALDFSPLAIAAGRVRHALLLGEAAPKLERAIGAATTCERVPDLASAVARAAALAEAGDVVLLSPACASFDQFSDFEARGEAFRRAVLEQTSEELDS